MEGAGSPPGESSAAWLEIIVPARNEAARLPAGLALLCAKTATLPIGAEIIVVDSASTDSTAEIVRQWPAGPTPVRLLRCDRPGKGAAIRAGLIATRAPFVGFCDADMATDLSALDVAIAQLQAGATVVLGSRAHPDSVVESRHSLLRRSGAVAFRWLAGILTNGVRDSQCGFKFFAGPIARGAAASLVATGFAFDIELIARCRRRGGLPIEIPVTWKDMAGSTFSMRRHALASFAEVGLIWVALRAPGLVRQPDSSPPAGPAEPAPAPAGDVAEVVSGAVIAIINWRDPWHRDQGGAERYAWEMALGLQRRGATVRYITARGPGQARRDRRDEVEIIRLGGKWTVYPRVLAWLALRRWSFDAVLDCQNGIPFFTPLVLPRRVVVLCVMHHVHDAQFGVHFPQPVAALGRWLEGPAARWCYRRRDCVAVSESTASAMRSRLTWRGPIHIIPNGLPGRLPDVAAAVPVGQPDVAAAVPVDQPDGLPGVVVTAPGSDAGRGGGAISLSFVGRLVAHKRAERVLDVADRLADSGILIDVIGTGAQQQDLAAAIAARSLGRQVRLHGYLPEQDKRALVAASLLHLNTSQGEGWGLCVLEAAALGVPTVAYDVDGLRDAVRDGETGWLVRDRDRIEDVVERAIKELADPARRAEIAAACQAWAARFDWDASASQLADLVGMVAKRDASPLAGRSPLVGRSPDGRSPDGRQRVG